MPFFVCGQRTKDLLITLVFVLLVLDTSLIYFWDALLGCTSGLNLAANLRTVLALIFYQFYKIKSRHFKMFLFLPAQVNPSLIYSSCEQIKVETDFRTTFGLVLKSKATNDASRTSSSDGADGKGYEPFKQFLKSNASDFRENEFSYSVTVDAFAS